MLEKQTKVKLFSTFSQVPIKFSRKKCRWNLIPCCPEIVYHRLFCTLSLSSTVRWTYNFLTKNESFSVFSSFYSVFLFFLVFWKGDKKISVFIFIFFIFKMGKKSAAFGGFYFLLRNKLNLVLVTDLWYPHVCIVWVMFLESVLVDGRGNHFLGVRTLEVFRWVWRKLTDFPYFFLKWS